MERIIINEVDNTSNVEALSSYDVVYVPGFADNGASPVFTDNKPSLFRNPTLVTNKYDFVNLFGANCPTFPKDQPYPIASESTSSDTDSYGFPTYAIPNYVPPVDPVQVENINSFIVTPKTGETEEDAIVRVLNDSDHYEDAFEASSNWERDPEVVYYEAKNDGAVDEGTKWIMWALEEAESYEGKVICTSSTIPNEMGWKVKFGDTCVYTDDQYISFDFDGMAETTVKEYFIDETAQALMFNGPRETSSGDPDPGYRYALYLLSLGIPVYYEQMNAEFEIVDLSDPALVQTANPKAEEWFVQIGNEYIRSKDESVQPDTVYFMGADISVESMYKGLEARFFDSDESVDYSFDSMGDYAVKYLTSGGYPTFEYGPLGTADPITGVAYGTSPLSQAMMRLAAKRGDALALIDHTNNPFRSIYETDPLSVVSRIRNEFSNVDTVDGSFGTMFTPWYNCSHKAITGGSAVGYSQQMPASLAYLSALAQQLRNYNPWLAVSGVSRGVVPYCGGLHTNYNLTNNVADSYQMLPGDTEALGAPVISINPITKIRNYGFCIWGNRTLRNNSGGTKVTSFLNIRNMVADIKKTLYDASLSLMFEQNTDILWINFKSIITPLLDTMVSNYILSDYKVTRYLLDPDSGQPVPAYKVLANIKITPINSVEVFDLTVTLENSEITVSETE